MERNLFSLWLQKSIEGFDQNFFFLLVLPDQTVLAILPHWMLLDPYKKIQPLSTSNHGIVLRSEVPSDHPLWSPPIPLPTKCSSNWLTRIDWGTHHSNQGPYTNNPSKITLFFHHPLINWYDF